MLAPLAKFRFYRKSEARVGRAPAGGNIESVHIDSVFKFSPKSVVPILSAYYKGKSKLSGGRVCVLNNCMDIL